jgi:hypothetical protein
MPLSAGHWKTDKEVAVGKVVVRLGLERLGLVTDMVRLGFVERLRLKLDNDKLEIERVKLVVNKLKLGTERLRVPVESVTLGTEILRLVVGTLNVGDERLKLGVLRFEIGRLRLGEIPLRLVRETVGLDKLGERLGVLSELMLKLTLGSEIDVEGRDIDGELRLSEADMEGSPLLLRGMAGTVIVDVQDPV